MNNEDYLQRLSVIRDQRCTPDAIDSLCSNEVFVFGTNPQGEHKSKAARTAVMKFGAIVGAGEGLFGQSYAIPVHKHRRSLMVNAVGRFIDVAKNNPNKKFLVLAIGCGAAGMDAAYVALMFRKAIEVENIFLPKLFIDELIKYYQIGVEISEDCTTLIHFPIDYKGAYTIPYGIESIGKGAFVGCFCKLKLPSSIKRIEAYAFSDMGAWDSYLLFPSSITHIDDKAFGSEWGHTNMLVEYQSYAYQFAKRHGIRYKCVDFDEEKYLAEKKAKEDTCNRANTGLRHFVNNIFARRDRRSYYPVPKGQIAIARDFAIVLNDDSHLTLLGQNDEFRQLLTGEKIIKVAAAFSGYMGLTESGRVITGGPAHEFERSRNIEWLRNVIDIVSCEGHTIALIEDGTVKCIDEPSGWEGPEQFDKIVANWHDIQQVAVGFCNVMGLNRDGRVLYHSSDGYTDTHFYDQFDDIVQIDCYSHYYGQNSSMVLHQNGTVSSDSFDNVDTWRDIIQISVGADVAIGLKKDGTIEIEDQRGTRLAVKEWKDLVYIECKFFGVVGITRDGRILSLY